MKNIVTLLLLTLAMGATSSESEVKEGFATYYTIKSCQREGTSGVYTANGEKYNEAAFTCALRSRKWNTQYKVTNLDTGKSVIVRHNDYGPGKKPTRGVIIDLTPAAYEALGGKKVAGKIRVKVEVNH